MDIKEMRRKLRSGKLKVEFADSREVARLKEGMDRLKRMIARQYEAEDVEGWCAHCFVSDLSTLGDFGLDKEQTRLLSKEVGFELHDKDYMKDIALRMGEVN